MSLPDFNSLLPLLIAFVLGITVHEFAHAYAAYQMGDLLPFHQGRVTLNPLAHLDPAGTVFIFLVGFGWGKPVQHRTYDPKQRMWISLAGPVSNLILAFIFGLLFRFGLAPALDIGPQWFNLRDIVYTTISINVLLAVFNMIPLSPLDGSSILAGLLPDPYGWRLAEFNARFPQALILFLLADTLLIAPALGRSILSLILGPPIRTLTLFFIGL